MLLSEKYPSLVKAFINIEGNLGIHDLFLSGLHAQHRYKYFEEEAWNNNKHVISNIDDVTVKSYSKRSEAISPKQLWLNSGELVAASFTTLDEQTISISTQKSIQSLNLKELHLSLQPAQRMALLKVPNYLLLGTKGGAHPYNLTLLKNAGLQVSNKSQTNDYCIVDGNHWLWQTNSEQTGVCIKKFITQINNN